MTTNMQIAQTLETAARLMVDQQFRQSHTWQEILEIAALATVGSHDQHDMVRAACHTYANHYADLHQENGVMLDRFGGWKEDTLIFRSAAANLRLEDQLQLLQQQLKVVQAKASTN